MSIATELSKLVNVFRDWPHEKREQIKFIAEASMSGINLVEGSTTPSEAIKIIKSGRMFDATFTTQLGMAMSPSSLQWMDNNAIVIAFVQSSVTEYGGTTLMTAVGYNVLSTFDEETGEWSDWECTACQLTVGGENS